MDAQLERETQALVRSWMRHEEGMLRDYLVAAEEDPRSNVQSILMRHFLLEELGVRRLESLERLELQFAAGMNWLRSWLNQRPLPEQVAALEHALRTGADNAEGEEVPHHLAAAIAGLPRRACGVRVPNYVWRVLEEARSGKGPAEALGAALPVFEGLWRQRLAKVRRPRLKVLEAACGSANDYRSLAGCGLAAHLEYLGVDLGEKNVRNASAMFPDARFEVGNVFELPYPDGAFECTLVQDLFEHLSADGLARAVAELCRVTRRALCAGFFNLDEIPEHVIRPVEEYHWNTLSLDRVRELFEARGGAVQALHTGAVLRWQASRAETHNPNAYTLIVRFA